MVSALAIVIAQALVTVIKGRTTTNINTKQIYQQPQYMHAYVHILKYIIHLRWILDFEF